MHKSCVFCDRNQFGERLIYESGNFNITAILGQMTDDGGHVLLSPKIHVPCMGALDDELAKESFDLGLRICRALALEYKRGAVVPLEPPYPVTAFEYGFMNRPIKHARLHFLPAVINMTPRIHADFSTAEIDELGCAAGLQRLYSRHPEPYLFWTTPPGKQMVCWNPPATPRYFRKIAADLLGRPERANWRTMDPELDRKLWSETVTRLKKYFR